MIHPRWFTCPDCGASDGAWCYEDDDRPGLHKRRVEVAANDPRNLQASEALGRDATQK